MKPEEFTSSLAKGDISSLYYFHGEETYLMEQAVRQATAYLVNPDFRDFNLNLFYGNECKGQEIAEVAQTLPFFTDKRLIIVKKADDLSSQALDLLTPYVQDPSPSTCLIFVGGKVDQRRKFFVEMKKKGHLVEFRRLYENQMPAFVRSEATRLEKKIDHAAIDLLVNLIGNSLQDVVSQMEKAAAYAGARDTITLEDVKEIVSDSRAKSVFDFANAVGHKDMGQALKALQVLVREGEALPLILAMLTRHFRQLWQVRELLDNKVAVPEIGKQTGINPYFLQDIVSQARHFRVGDFMVIFDKFFGADMALKTGKGDVVVERLIFDICHGS